MNDPRALRDIALRAITAIAALALLLNIVPLRRLGAQGGTAPARRSIMFGGMVLPQSELAVFKASVDWGHWAVIADITRDGTREEWSVDGSAGDYLLWGAAGSVRRYSRPGGRGYFLELGVGAASLNLEVTEADGRQATRRADLPVGGWAFGRRFGIGRGPGFLELAYRSTVPLETRHLYVDAQPPEARPERSVSHRAWYLASGQGHGQLYAGFGLSF